MANKESAERKELHRKIWAIADDVRGAVDGWDFKQYIPVSYTHLLLEQWGYEVVAVEDFMDVLGIFVESDPHLILMDIVMAINMGGDDFVTKPFDQNVLLAKVQGLLRRSYEFGTDQNLLEHRGAILNLKSTDLVYEGEVIKLTKNEFQILRVLFEHAGSIVARDDMMKELWNSDFFIDDNTLSVNVARLRKKLEEAGLSNFIETKKGIGYGLTHE